MIENFDPNEIAKLFDVDVTRLKRIVMDPDYSYIELIKVDESGKRLVHMDGTMQVERHTIGRDLSNV